MSLEKAIEALTAAVIANTAALAGKAESPKADPKPAKQTPSATSHPSPVSTVAATSTATHIPILNKDGECEAYVPLKHAFLNLVKVKGRDAALAAIAPLTALNAIKAGEQGPGQYAVLMVAIQKATATESSATSLV